MAEPTSTAAFTLTAATVTIQVVTLFGIPIGLRPDLLVAGFAGALAAIILLNSVPATGDTWRELVRTTTRRMGVVMASSLTAGYLTPLPLLVMTSVPNNLLLGSAFVVGAGAQQLLAMWVRRFRSEGGTANKGGNEPTNGGGA